MKRQSHFIVLIILSCLLLFNCSKRIIPKTDIKTTDSLDKEWFHHDFVPLIFGSVFQTSEVSGEKVPKQISLLKATKLARKQAAEWDSRARLAFIDAIALFSDSRMNILQWNFVFAADGKSLLIKIAGKKIEAVQSVDRQTVKWNFLEDITIEMLPSAEGTPFSGSGFGHFYIAVLEDDITRSPKVLFSSLASQVIVVFDPLSRKFITPSESLIKSIQVFQENRLVVTNPKNSN